MHLPVTFSCSVLLLDIHPQVLKQGMDHRCKRSSYLSQTKDLSMCSPQQQALVKGQLTDWDEW